jgi:hypothetical protein
MKLLIMQFNSLLRRILGPKRVINRMIMSRRIRCAGHEARMGEKRNAYRFLVVKPEKKEPLGRPRYRWKNNIMTCRPISRQRLAKHIPAATNTQAIIG